VEIAPGARLLAFTDGLTELFDPDGAQWGDSEAVGLLESSDTESPGGLLELVLDRVTAFRRGEAQGDDLTIIVAQFDPTSPESRVDRLDTPIATRRTPDARP
jgi:sigma-B regulation protein RsbU (phosphoserine phosphatase)